MAPPPHPFRSLDFYRDPDTRELGVAWNASEDPYMRAVDLYDVPGAINLQPVSEYLEARFGKGKEADRETARWYVNHGFVRPDQAPYPLPERPDLALKEWEANSETGSLLTDLSTWFGEHVRLPTEASAVSIATWNLRAWLPETAPHAPPLLFLGVPRTGKTRAVRALRLVARKAEYLGAPSVASLYALSDLYQPTFLIDEWAHVVPELRRAVEGLMRIGFDPGGSIPRRKEHSEGVRRWKAFAFYAVASRIPLADDLMDRAVPVYMREVQEVPELNDDDPTARDMRTACLRYRLEVLAGTSHRQPAEDARTRVKEAILPLNPVVRLSDRGLDKAQTLASVAIPFDVLDDTIDAIVIAERESGLMYQFSTEAFVVQAIRDLTAKRPTLEGNVAVALGEIHRAVWEALMLEGMSMRTLENHDPVPVERLGPLVRTMGFNVIRRNTGMHIVERAEDLTKKFASLSAKYEGPT